MSKSKATKMKNMQIAEEEVERLLRDHDEEVVGAIRQLLADRVSKPTGRRVEPDWPVLMEMARIISSGRTEAVQEAARMVAHQAEGSQEETVVERLRKKYPKHRLELEAEVASEAATEGEADSQDSIISRAFEEDVDVWDL